MKKNIEQQQTKEEQVYITTSSKEVIMSVGEISIQSFAGLRETKDTILELIESPVIKDYLDIRKINNKIKETPYCE